jgi:hypothetical protein
MRYKARSDLERIWELVNKNTFGRANKEIIENQFKIFDSNKEKKNKNEDDEKEDEFIENKKHLNVNPKDLEKKQKTREQIKKEMNVDAKNIMSELHVKTHFKGATSLANSHSMFINNLIIYILDLSSPKKNLEDSLKNKKQTHILIDLPSLYGEEWPTISKPIRKTAEFTKHFNPKKMNKDNEHVTNNDLQQIRNIAFSDKNFLNDQFCKYLNNYKNLLIFSQEQIDNEYEFTKKF